MNALDRIRRGIAPAMALLRPIGPYMIGGGALRDLARGSRIEGDVDVYTPDHAHAARAIEHLVRGGFQVAYRTPFVVRLERGDERDGYPSQVDIALVVRQTPADFILNNDIVASGAALTHDGVLHAHPEFLSDADSSVLRTYAPPNPVATLARIQKLIRRGWHVGHPLAGNPSHLVRVQL